MGTFNDLIDRTIAYLNQDGTNEPKRGTVTEMLMSSPPTISSLKIEPVDGQNTNFGPCVVEIGNRLIYSSYWDSNTTVAVVPAWGNGYRGTSAIPAPVSGVMATIDPIWSRWHVGQVLIGAINNLYPRLYKITKTTLTSTVNGERYTVPTDCEEVLKLQVEWFGPSFPRRAVKEYSLETVGEHVLSMRPIGVTGRPIHLWYRSRPTMPTDPTDTSWTWASSGLPASAEDLPVLFAASQLIVSPEAAKTQTYSAEQSDRNRLVQSGTGTAASRRMQELYQARLAEEQQKLSNQYPVRVHYGWNS